MWITCPPRPGTRGKRGCSGDKPFWFGRFRYHSNIAPQRHQGIDLAMAANKPRE